VSPILRADVVDGLCVVAIGWAVARAGRLGSGDAARVLSGAAFYIFVPALLFRTSARIDFQRLDIRVLIAFFAPTLVLVVLVYAVLRLRRASDAAPAEPSVRAITASFGNAVQIGIPLAAALFGETGLALHLTVVGVHSLVLLTVLTTLVEVDLAHAQRRTDGGNARLVRMLATTARNTIVHPVVLPVVAGLAWNLAGARLPTLADEILATLGQAVVPVCLVLIGVSLAHYGVRGALRTAGAGRLTTRGWGGPPAGGPPHPRP
jgi:predicted permease